MKQSFEQLMDAIEKNLNYCPWAKGLTFEHMKEQIANEAEEMAQAVDNKDYENLKEELGDLLWDTMMLAMIAEKEGRFKAEEVIDEIVAKMRRRKPQIFEGRTVTAEEAHRIWNEAKAKEVKAKCKPLKQ